MPDNKKEQEREEIHRAIWAIADDLRGSVDGWDFKSYVLGIMFYRYISENLTNYINADEIAAGNADFDYAKLSDEEAEQARDDLVKTRGFFILPSELFVNVRARAPRDDNLNMTMEAVFRHIEDSAKGTESEDDFAGLFDDIDVNSNKLGATVAKRNAMLVKLLDGIPYPNTKYQALVKLLKRAIKEFGKTNRLKAIEFSKKLKNVIDRYNSRNTISDVEDIIEDVVDNLSEELEKIFSDLKKEKQSFEAMDITYEEKAFYDILIAVAEKYGFKDQLAEDTYIFLAKEIQKLVGNKSKYTDWTNRQDVKDELYADVAKLLKKHGYPPRTIDDAYDEIMKQVDNYKQYAD